MTEEMLIAGVIPSSWYVEDSYYWNERRMNSMEQIESEDILQFYTSTNYEINAYQTYWCFHGLLNCSTSSTTLYTNLPYSKSYTTTLPSYAWYGNLEAHHKITKTTSGSQTVDTNNYQNVKVNGQWVHTCNGTYNVLVPSYGFKTINFCPSSFSGPGTYIASTVYGS